MVRSGPACTRTDTTPRLDPTPTPKTRRDLRRGQLLAAAFALVAQGGPVIGVATQVYFQPGAIDPEAAIDEAARCLLARLVA